MSAEVSNITAISKPKRYHPALVALHWIIAIFIFVTPLFVGEDGERGLSLGGVPALGIHMILGIIILVLLVIRLIVRWRTRLPDWATTGSAFLDKIGVLTHWALYFFMFAIIVTGLVLALQTNRFARVFNIGNQTRPQFAQGGQFQPPAGFQPGQSRRGGEGFEGGEGFQGLQGRLQRGGGFLLGAFHGLSWTLLLLLILLHIGAALYHQFWRRDNLLARMWFGRQT